eukprot:TRINITY_DN428_c0_g1_i13.p1 TRINITY_DN428_c0_g1~~TRINITY_DN428_c0_g1_i13.p1  ORF type:complete len:197 (-),score=68.96 TRINITY_DN428_c0_g1_i13:302-892(-)
MKVFIALSALLAVSLAEEAKVVASPLAYGYPYGGLAYGGYAHAGLPYAAAPAYTYAAAPAPVAAAPVVAAAPAPVAYAAAAPAYAAYAPYTAGSQFHAQDEFGNLNYGYANINSVKQEVGNTYGGVTGGYSYVDANGQLQQVEYVADGAGFRVADSRLPVAPVYDGVRPHLQPRASCCPNLQPRAPCCPSLHRCCP